MNGPIWPNFKLLRDDMPVLVISNFDKVQQKMKKISIRQDFPHYKSMGKFFNAQGLITLKRMIWPGPNSNLSEIFCLSWIPASLKELRLKLNALPPGQHFPYYTCKSMGHICCHGNHSFEQICSKSISIQSPTQTILYMKFDQDWTAKSGDIHVWKCGRKDALTTDPLAQVS